MLYSMDEYWKHFAKWKKSNTEDYKVYDLVWKSKIGKSIETKSR